MESKLYHVKLRLSKPGFKSKTISGFVMGEKYNKEKAGDFARQIVEKKVFDEIDSSMEVKVVDVNKVSFSFFLNGKNKEQP